MQATATPHPDPLIDDRQLADRLGWNQKSPSVMRAKGTLPIPFIRVGRRIRYRSSAVESYLNSRTVQPVKN